MSLLILEKDIENNITKIGMLATIIGIISFLPVLLVIAKTRKTNNFPYVTLTLALISNITWIVYGAFKGAKASMVMGILYVLIYAFILVVKVFGTRKSK